ncbi:MAG: DUF2817 domain-containing protein [Pseudobdellovibrionaceae bacterium]
MIEFLFFLAALQFPALATADEKPVKTISDLCKEQLAQFPGPSDSKLLAQACDKVQVAEGCQSVKGQPIFHYEREGKSKNPHRVLVFSLIHGDETHAGSIGRFWMERLESIDPRNTWRVIPILNPDGVATKTRTNANLVDLNRNFPTKDWTDKAQDYWKRLSNSNPRRFPGDTAASEPETKCALKHIEDFKSDFIVSIHTPLKVLDFDGPRLKKPNFSYLPWTSLGHYPGSLGRYMWFERKIPVLTMELKEDLPKTLKPFEELQDIIGVLVGLDHGPRNPAETSIAH